MTPNTHSSPNLGFDSLLKDFVDFFPANSEGKRKSGATVAECWPSKVPASGSSCFLHFPCSSFIFSILDHPRPDRGVVEKNVM